jgi:DNA invertase Pin-like site-specific DNA recombinase
LQNRSIGFRSLQESIDTTTSGGKLIFHVFAALAEFERDVIRERTAAGLAAARARGRRGGRPRSLLSEENRLALARLMFRDKTRPVRDIYTTLGVPRSTFYRYIRQTMREEASHNPV